MWMRGKGSFGARGVTAGGFEVSSGEDDNDVDDDDGDEADEAPAIKA